MELCYRELAVWANKRLMQCSKTVRPRRPAMLLDYLVGDGEYNPALVTRKPDGNIGGVSANLGKFIAERLGLRPEPVVYARPESGVQSYGKDEWDVMIGPRVPAAEQKADFGPDILLVDNIYVAAPGHDFADAGQVDKPGVKIGVVQNAIRSGSHQRPRSAALSGPTPKAPGSAGGYLPSLRNPDW
jgi:hypothetical protein